MRSFHRLILSAKFKTMLKRTLKITLYTTIIIFLTYNYLLSDFNPMFKDEEFIYLTKKLKATEKEDLKFFIETYNKINKNKKKQKEKH